MKHLLAALIFTCMMAISYHASAATVTYTFDNIWQEGIHPTYIPTEMTGTFVWTHVDGDITDGAGVFTALSIPGFTGGIGDLDIEVQSDNIQISINGEYHSQNVGVNLWFTPLSATIASDIDLVRSTWEDIEGTKHAYISGSIVPTVVPIPAAIWLFISGVLGLLFIGTRKLH